MIGAFIIFGVLSATALAVVLYDPAAARLTADGIERLAQWLVSVLRAHAEAREAARLAYRRTYRFCRMGAYCPAVERDGEA